MDKHVTDGDTISLFSQSVDDHNRTKSFSIMRIIGISCSLLGYQLAYSCNFSLTTPIMESLQIPQYLHPIIWWAAPVADLVQPIIGYYSDQSHFRFGRRRQYIVLGGIGTIIGFALIFVCEHFKSIPQYISQWIFTAAFIEMNLALNILQAPARNLIGDILPQHQQIVGNTIGTIMNGLGAVLINFIGSLNLSHYISESLSNREFILIVSMIGVFAAIFVTLIAAREKVNTNPPSPVSMWRQIVLSFTDAPTEVYRAATCFSLSWCGFFMFFVEATDFFGKQIFHGQPSSCSQEEHCAEYELYLEGVNFGMLTIAMTYTISLVYGFVQSRLIDWFGARICFAGAQLLEVCAYIAFNFIPFDVEHKWYHFTVLSLMGVSFLSFNSVPFAIVAMAVPEEDMGKFMAVVNSFGCVGQLTANLVIGSGVAALTRKITCGVDMPNVLITCGALPALGAAILSARLIIPKERAKSKFAAESVMTEKPLLS